MNLPEGVWLCDIGNTHAHIASSKGVEHLRVDSLQPQAFVGKVYYMSVNGALSKALAAHTHWVDIASWVALEGAYPTMGIDRQLAAWYCHDGVVVDAGSAITVDVMESGRFLGGFIGLGVNAMKSAYKGISNALDYSFNFELSLDTMPKNSQDAITYGAFVPLVEHIKNVAQHRPILCTGGDGAPLARWLHAPYERDYLLQAMHALLTTKGELC